jgi:uncharacterized protein
MTTSILNHPLISQRYLFPRHEGFAEPFWVDVDDARLACYYHQPHPGKKTIVHFHGNGEVVADYLNGFVSIVERLGYNCFLAEFRGYGMSTGVSALGRILDDVAPLIRAIGRPEQELVLFGRSVGSIFAIQAASLFPHISGLILESAVADPLERLLLRITPQELGVSPTAFAAEVASCLDHRSKMEAYVGPTLVMHTRHDGLVDVSHGERLYRWAGGEKTLHIFPHGNHNNIMAVNAQEYFPLIQAFLDAC